MTTISSDNFLISGKNKHGARNYPSSLKLIGRQPDVELLLYGAELIGSQQKSGLKFVYDFGSASNFMYNSVKFCRIIKYIQFLTDCLGRLIKVTIRIINKVN